MTGTGEAKAIKEMREIKELGLGRRWLFHAEGSEQGFGGAGHFGHSGFEDRLVGARGDAEAADLADVLAGGGLNFSFGGRFGGTAELFNGAAHNISSLVTEA